MARLNTAIEREVEYTHGGSVAAQINAEQRLRRSVLSCLLWENEHYEDGDSVAKRIEETAHEVSLKTLADLAITARSQYHLRHVPLFLASILAYRNKTSKTEKIVMDTIEAVIQRADELGEFLALYAKTNNINPANLKGHMANQVKKGLAKAFTKFDAYQLAKYDRATAVRLRDVLFLSHAKPKDAEQAATWKQLIENTLPLPDTWEVGLSSGKDKKETFERLIQNNKLGYLALLKNLSGIEKAGCNTKLVRDAILARKGAANVLPFRYIAAAKAAPRFEDAIDEAFLAATKQMPRLTGKTIVIVDVSGSMYYSGVSAKSDMTRADAACALGAIARELCEEPVIYATAGSDMARKHQTELVPARHGLALVDAIREMCSPLGGGGIFLKQVMDYVLEKEKNADRIIVITDEQDCAGDNSPQRAKAFGKQNYLINVASHKNGIGYGKWTHIDGFSEQIFQYIKNDEGNWDSNVNPK